MRTRQQEVTRAQVFAKMCEAERRIDKLAEQTLLTNCDRDYARYHAILEDMSRAKNDAKVWEVTYNAL